MADTSSKSRELEQEAEIIPAIRHDDAEWKMIQQNTFTRWVNNHLKKANSSITNLENDFSDGLKLIELAMVLSQKKLGKFNKKVMFRSQKLENVSLALNFFQDAEKIKIVNIDSSHIVDKNKKLILGLIWTLILHYSISMGLITEKREGHPEETPKQKLLAWIRSKLPGGMPLTNFTSDWNDGVALGALVNALVPSACPDWETWHPANSLKNTEQAIKSAQEKLSIEPLITSAELIHPEIDEMSVMTYLSQFPTAKPVSSPAKSLPPPVAVPSVRGEFVGLEDFPTVHTPLEFAIQISEEGYRPKVSSQDPHGVDLHHTINKKNSQLYSVKCTPTKVGDHKFQLFLVDVATAETIPVEDETVVIKVLPSPRLMPFTDRVKLGDHIKFQVKDAFMGLVDIVIVDPESSEIHLPVLEEQSGLHSADYIPSIKGLHTVNAFYRKSRIEGSPFALHVHEKIPEYNIWGRGLRDIGVRVGDEVPICLTPIVPDQNSDDIQIAVSTAAGMTLPVTESNRLTPTRVFTYTPTTEGKHKIEVKTKDTLLGKSPYMVDVAPLTNSAVRAYGPGLRGGVANMPSVFEVLTNGQADSLSFSIEGPSKTTIQCSDKSDGVASVAYTPTEPGIYSVNVLAGGEHIQDSPFVLNVEPHDNSFQPGAVRITGLDSNTIHRTHQPVIFQIDSRRSGISNPVELVVFNNNLESIPVKITEKSPGMYDAEFTPSQPAKYHVDASLCGVAVPGAPFSITAKEPVDVSKLHMYGPGIEGPVYSQEPTHFTIDAKQAGTGVVEVSLDDRAGRAVDIDVLDNSDGSFTVKYTAPRPGAYQLNVVFAGEKIPPIQINVKPHFDTSGIHVDGLENGSALIGHRWNINVDTGLQRQKTQGLEVVAEVKEKEYLIPMTANDTKYAGVFVATEAGDLKFKVLFDNLLVKEFFANVSHGCDASKCRATGSGLTEGIVNVPATFKINTQGAGEGDLAVDIAGPSDTDSRIVDHEDRTCSVEFTPREPGTYTIDVMYGDKKHKIPGSPFNCNVDYPIDPSTVQVCGIDKPLRNRQPFDFVVDASRTKLGPVTCRVPAVYQQPLLHASSESKRIHNVRFTPVGDPGDEIPLEVFYCDVPVGEGPYMLKLLPEVDVYNLTLKNDLGGVLKNIRAKKNARLMLDGSNCGYVKTLQADVLGPDGCSRECTIEPHENKGLFIITFPVDMAGKYKIASSINGISSPPQFVDILPVAAPEDAVLKTPLNLQDCHIPLNVSSSLTFELKDDPDLTLAIIPTVKDAVDIKRVSQKLPSGKLLEEVILTPLTPGVNSIAFFFGGIKVHQIDYNAVADLKPTPIRKESVDKFERNYSVAENTKPLQQLDFKFDISTNTSGSDNLDAFVTMPSGSRDVAQIIDNHDGSVLVKYQPKTHGQHELSIVQNGAAVNGSPLKFFVDAYGDGLATVYGPGLTNAVVGEPAHFTVCAKGSNAKELSVSIEGPAQSTIKIHDNKDGTCSVNWMPPVPGEYKVHVKLGNHEVKESPFRVLVAGTGQKRAHLSVGSTSEVALSINNAEIKGVSASIKSPSGIDEPCLVRLIDGGKLGVSFTPREAGEHLITVKRDGKLVSKAPFKIKVEKSQVGDASKVEVTGKGKASAVCLQENEIIVDTTKAGYGGLSVSVQGPSKAELTCKEVKAGLIKVLYKPTEPGVYAIAVKFADHHVKDSPLTVNCTGKGAGTIQSLLKKKTEQAPMCLPNQEAVLYMKLANCSPMDTTARIMDPKGKTEDVEMRDTGSNFYLIKFRPAMEGVHNLSILHRDSHVNGSPFQFTVGSFKEGGAHKVRASGLGVVRGETNSKQYFNIYTREAGAGDLSVSIEGPSKPSFEFKDHKDGNCHVEYQVATPGEYNVSIKFNDVHIADSPFKVFIAAATGEARKLELASFHDQIPTGKAFTFTVLTHRARGHLEAKVTTPSHLTETIDIVPIEEGESYALRFIPKESGNHYIHVTLDGAPMRDSPFRIRVGGADLSDPTAIHAEGEGLVSGETGHKCEFVIKTVNAGSGVLTCQIDGPSKVTLDAYETTQGYKVRYTPLAPGDYFAAVKYNGVHIPGSPFKIVIDGKVLGGNGYNESSEVKVDARAKTSQGNVATVPEYKGDASKVVAKGAGLNKFFPGRPSVFTIDTGLAGTNLLMVGVVTTKGPCDEVIVKHQGNGHYAVNYRIPDRVKGFVFIKYGDQEIPGSPFSISP